MAPSRHLLVVNPSSGGGRARKVRADAERLLSAQGIAFRAIETTSLEHGVAEAAAAAEAGEIPVVISGDGLIGAVGGALAGTDGVMGVIPGGRGNDFARVAGIPVKTDEAVAVLARGERRRIDVGEANGQRFLCIASLGFDSDANRIANESKLPGGLVYAYAALRALKSWKPASFKVAVDGSQYDTYGYSVAVANGGAYGGGMMMAPDAALDDGVFDVVLNGDASKLSFIKGIPDVFKGAHVERDDVNVVRGTKVRVEADRPFVVYADGEPITETPVEMKVLPGALNLIAPPAE